MDWEGRPLPDGAEEGFSSDAMQVWSDILRCGDGATPDGATTNKF
jgi:hypothetical protein